MEKGKNYFFAQSKLEESLLVYIYKIFNDSAFIFNYNNISSTRLDKAS